MALKVDGHVQPSRNNNTSGQGILIFMKGRQKAQKLAATNFIALAVALSAYAIEIPAFDLVFAHNNVVLHF